MNFAKLLRGWWRSLWTKPKGANEMHETFIDPKEELFYECDT